MEKFSLFIIRNDVWMLILAVLGLIWFGSELYRAQSALQEAVFGLEREHGRRARNSALTFVLLLTAVVSVVLYVNYQVAPTLPDELLRPPTPTPDPAQLVLVSPTPLPTPPPTPTPPIVPTITLAAEPGLPPVAFITDTTSITDEVDAGSNSPLIIVTLAPTPTPVVGCNVQLTTTAPRNGAIVSGLVEFFGTVNTPDFGGYTLEANGPQTNGQWASLLGRTFRQPVVDGLLGNVNLSQWESGPYLVRLTALNGRDEAAYQCVIQVTLDNETP